MKMLENWIRKISTQSLKGRFCQNNRLLREFPWLWAVRGYWELATDLIQVNNPDQFHLSAQIDDDRTNHPARIGEIWVHGMKSMNGRPLEFVQRIWNEEDAQKFVPADIKTWEELVRPECRKSYVMHFAIATAGCEVVTVLRPTKHHESFNALWNIGC